MESNNKCDCRCDLSKINLDMTVRECLEKMGVKPEKAQECLQNCCKDCCKCG